MASMRLLRTIQWTLRTPISVGRPKESRKSYFREASISAAKEIRAGL